MPVRNAYMVSSTRSERYHKACLSAHNVVAQPIMFGKILKVLSISAMQPCYLTFKVRETYLMKWEKLKHFCLFVFYTTCLKCLTSLGIP